MREKIAEKVAIIHRRHLPHCPNSEVPIKFGYEVADQILSLFREEIEKLKPAKLKAVPNPIWKYSEDTLQDKASYTAGFQDGAQAQLAKIQEDLRKVLRGD
jgi:hypothetical protein